jgi:hypothetical protein
VERRNIFGEKSLILDVYRTLARDFDGACALWFKSFCHDNTEFKQNN